MIETLEFIGWVVCRHKFLFRYPNINLRMVFYKLSPSHRYSVKQTFFKFPPTVIPRQTHLFPPRFALFDSDLWLPSLTSDQRTVSISFTWSTDFFLLLLLSTVKFVENKSEWIIVKSPSFPCFILLYILDEKNSQYVHIILDSFFSAS